MNKLQHRSSQATTQYSTQCTHVAGHWLAIVAALGVLGAKEGERDDEDGEDGEDCGLCRVSM